MGNTVTEITCAIASKLKNIEPLVALGEKFGAFCGFGEDESVQIGMALREALNNAVVHGNGKDASKEVRVVFQCTGEEIRISVKDEGPGFSTNGLPDPTDPMNLLKTSGRGIFCIHNFMDRVDLSRASREGGEIIMFKRLLSSCEST